MAVHRIHQEISFQASVEKVYAALTQADKFAAATGAAAEISAEVGGSFFCFDGMITGRHIELVPNERIVQAWRVANWAEGEWSLVKFELQPDRDQTILTLEQVGHSDAAHEHLETGWGNKYWQPLQAAV